MHRLYRDATMFVRGTHCKDLSKLNRDVRKIVVVDKDRAAVQLQPGNAIIVKPYTDATDRLDTELEDLTPFLAALVNENVRDVPAALAKFSSNDATVVAAEYGDMLKEAKNKTDAVRKIGLGGFVRGRARQPEPDLALEPAGTMLSAAGLSAKDIAGDAPEATPKKGGIFGGIKSAFKSLASKAVTLGGGVLGGLVGGPIGSRLGAAFGGGLGSSMFGKKKASGGVDHSRSVINFKIQQAMNKRKEMYDMISNVLKTMHDMSMTSIRNIK